MAGRPAAYRATLTCAAVSLALMPAYTVRWHWFGILPTTLLETAILVTLVFFLIETVTQGQRIAWRTPILLPALLFLLAGALDVVFAPDRRAALGLYRAYFVEPMAFFVVLLTIVTTVRRAYAMAAGLGVAALALGVPNGLVVLDAAAHHRLDLSGTPPVVIVQTANAVALFLLPAIAIALALAAYGKGRPRGIAAGFLIICVPAFLLTLSRGGFLALGAVLLALALTHRRRLWYIAGIAVAGAVFVILPPVHKRIAYELSFNDPHNTLVGRLPLWKVTLQMLRQHPLFGAGLSGFEQRIAPLWNPTHVDRFVYPHNILLNFWVATGMLGVLAFAWILVQAFRSSWRGWRSNTAGWSVIDLGVFLALIGIVVHGLVDVPYFKNDLSLEFWLLMGLLYAGVRWSGFRPNAIVSGLPK